MILTAITLFVRNGQCRSEGNKKGADDMKFRAYMTRIFYVLDNSDMPSVRRTESPLFGLFCMCYEASLLDFSAFFAGMSLEIKYFLSNCLPEQILKWPRAPCVVAVFLINLGIVRCERLYSLMCVCWWTEVNLNCTKLSYPGETKSCLIYIKLMKGNF